MNRRKTSYFVLAMLLSIMGALSLQTKGTEAATGQEEEKISVSYQTHVQDIGWQDPVKDGETSGTVGKGLRLEGIKIDIGGSFGVDVHYKTHIQEIGWGDSMARNGMMSGTEGRGLRLEAISIELAGGSAYLYDIYYRVHSQDYGWLDWAKNGQYAGTEGQSKRLEGIEIKIVGKGEAFPGATGRPYIAAAVGVRYQAYVEGKGWMPYVENGAAAGTLGEGLSMENLRVSLSNLDKGEGDVSYGYTSLYGTGPKQPDFSQYDGYTYDKLVEAWYREIQGGSLGKFQRIGIALQGKAEEKYDIYYRVHLGQKGWLDWASNGTYAGQLGYNAPVVIQAIEIVVVPKGSPAPGSTEKPFITSRESM